jgi:hypothetical protein
MRQNLAVHLTGQMPEVSGSDALKSKPFGELCVHRLHQSSDRLKLTQDDKGSRLAPIVAQGRLQVEAVLSQGNL